MSDQVIAEIERSIDKWTEATDQMCFVYYSGDKWTVCCTVLDIRATNADVMVALREFERLTRAHLTRNDKLAQTLGLEAAE